MLGIPVLESKGKKEKRVVLLTDRAFEICQRLALKNPEGPMFRTSAGKPWTRRALSFRPLLPVQETGIRGLPVCYSAHVRNGRDCKRGRSSDHSDVNGPRRSRDALPHLPAHQTPQRPSTGGPKQSGGRMTDDLETGIAAGLDVPTALSLSQDDEPPQRVRAGRGLAWVLLLGSVVALTLWWLSH